MKIKRSEIDMVACCREVQSLKFDGTATIKDMFDAFYSVMEKYGVCQWQEELGEDGRIHTTGATMEWVICKTIFNENTIGFILTTYNMLNPVPDAIQCFKIEDKEDGK